MDTLPDEMKGIDKKSLDVAEALLTALVTIYFGPTGGLIAKGVLSIGSKLIPDPTLEQQFEKLKCDLAKRVKKRLHDKIIADRAIEILETTFRGTPDLYEAKENPENLARMLLARPPNLLLRESEKGKVCELLTALFKTYRDFPEVVAELERAFRNEMRRSLPKLDDILEDPTPTSPDTSAFRRPSLLFDARHAIVPFFEKGRRQALKEFRDWLDSDEPFSALTIPGPGGIGKTRFMYEALSRATGRGWTGGFLKGTATEDRIEKAVDTLPELKEPLLLVVDYVEDRLTEALHLLNACRQKEPAPKRRIVFLTRNIDFLLQILVAKDGSAEGHSAKAVLPYLEKRKRLPDFALEHLTDRRQAFIEARETYLEKIPDIKKDGEPTRIPDEAFFDHDHFKNILHVHIAAYASIKGKLIRKRDELFKFALNREWNYLTSLFKNDPELRDITGKRMREPLARATLAMAARPSRDTVPAIDDFLNGTTIANKLDADELGNLKTILARLYPWPDGGTHHMDALRPDPLGEALVYEVIEDRPALLHFALSPERDEASRASAVTVLLRTALAFEPDAPSAWLEGLPHILPHHMIDTWLDVLDKPDQYLPPQYASIRINESINSISISSSSYPKTPSILLPFRETILKRAIEKVTT